MIMVLFLIPISFSNHIFIFLSQKIYRCSTWFKGALENEDDLQTRQLRIKDISAYKENENDYLKWKNDNKNSRIIHLQRCYGSQWTLPIALNVRIIKI